MRTIYDAHAHLGTEEERRWRREHGIVTMVCAGDQEESKILSGLEDSHLVKAYGIHPWKADSQDFEEMVPFLEKADIIGEIGMDRIWCQVPIKRQREIFERQLALAFCWKKPVVLHVKGMEREAAKIIRRYPGTYLVHWYSDMEGLEDYLEQGCYATVGPDGTRNPAVCQVLEKTPLSRLMVETDGLGAVQWALGDNVKLQDLRNVLEDSIQSIAVQKGVTMEEAYQWTEVNFLRFAAGK